MDEYVLISKLALVNMTLEIHELIGHGGKCDISISSSLYNST